MSDQQEKRREKGPDVVDEQDAPVTSPETETQEELTEAELDQVAGGVWDTIFDTASG